MNAKQGPKRALHLLAFGGSGSSPGHANVTIASVASRAPAADLIIAEPEIGDEFASQAKKRGSEISVLRIPDGRSRRRFLTHEEIDRYKAWLESTAGQLRMVIVGDVSTTARIEPGSRMAEVISHTPVANQVAAVFGLSGPKTKGLGWVARQASQLLRVAKFDHVDVIGQSSHLDDYAEGLLGREYGRLGIGLGEVSNHGPRAEELRVWDTESDQAWVSGPDAWTRRLPLARLMIAAEAAAVHLRPASAREIPGIDIASP